MDNVPHLALPLRVQGEAYATVQQDTVDEVRGTVVAIVSFPVGSRIEAPEFGVPELELADRPLDTLALEEAIEDSEPRALLAVTEQPYDPNDPLASRLRITVAIPGESEEVG